MSRCCYLVGNRDNGWVWSYGVTMWEIGTMGRCAQTHAQTHAQAWLRMGQWVGVRKRMCKRAWLPEMKLS